MSLTTSEMTPAELQVTITAEHGAMAAVSGGLSYFSSSYFADGAETASEATETAAQAL